MHGEAHNDTVITHTAFDDRLRKKSAGARHFSNPRETLLAKAFAANRPTAGPSRLRWLMAVLAAACVGQVGEAFEPDIPPPSLPPSTTFCESGHQQAALHLGEECRPSPGGYVSVRDKENAWDNTYTLAWGSVPGQVTYFELHRKRSGERYFGRVYRGITRQYRENSVSMGTHEYKVQACNGNGCGDFGPKTTVRVGPPLPGPGSSVTLTEKVYDQDNDYRLTWGTSTGTVTRYELRRWKAPHTSRGDSGFVENATMSDGARRDRREAAMPLGRYRYRVRACNSSGCGDFGPAREVNVYLPHSSSLSIVAKDDDQDDHYYLRLPGTGGVVAKYQLERWKAPQGSTAFVRDTTTDVTTWYHWQTRMAAGHYKYRIRPCDRHGTCGNYSNDVYARVYLPRGGSLSIVAKDSDRDDHYYLRLPSPGGLVAKHQLERWKAPQGSTAFVRDTTTDVTTWYHWQTEMTAGHYKYRIRPCDRVGTCGTYGNDVYVRVYLPHSSSLSITAKDNDQDDHYSLQLPNTGGVVAKYQLERWKAPQGSNAFVRGATTDVTASSHSQTRMTAGHYKYRIRPCDRVGTCGNYSNDVYARVYLPRGGSLSIADKDNDQDNVYYLRLPTPRAVVAKYRLYRWKAPQNNSCSGSVHIGLLSSLA